MKKILVIEDEGIILLSTLNLLQNNGFEAISAMNGEAGLELAKELLPDLILCNLRLPKLMGDEVYRELRKYPATATIPFIFVTAQSTGAEFEQLRQLGASNYLVKPFTSQEVLQAIANILG